MNGKNCQVCDGSSPNVCQGCGYKPECCIVYKDNTRTYTLLKVMHKFLALYGNSAKWEIL